MKRRMVLLVAMFLLGTLSACMKTTGDGSSIQSAEVSAKSSSEKETSAVQSASEGKMETGNVESPAVLVAYFSATGNTEGVAQRLQNVLDADIYEIVPETAYTEEDLDYSDAACRANREQNDPGARPPILGVPENVQDYDVVFLGYPIWWGKAPKVIYTFLESGDFTDAVIVPFCTSGSSGIGASVEELQSLTGNAHWQEGRRFDAKAEEYEMTQWIEELSLELD